MILAARHRQRPDPTQHVAEQSAVQMPIGQQQPVIARELLSRVIVSLENLVRDKKRRGRPPRWLREGRQTPIGGLSVTGLSVRAIGDGYR